MSDSEMKTFDDVEKGDVLEVPNEVDKSVHSDVHDIAAPGQGVYAKFGHYNQKLEKKLGIETVSRVVFV